MGADTIHSPTNLIYLFVFLQLLPSTPPTTIIHPGYSHPLPHAAPSLPHIIPIHSPNSSINSHTNHSHTIPPSNLLYPTTPIHSPTTPLLLSTPNNYSHSLPPTTPIYSPNYSHPLPTTPIHSQTTPILYDYSHPPPTTPYSHPLPQLLPSTATSYSISTPPTTPIPLVHSPQLLTLTPTCSPTTPSTPQYSHPLFQLLPYSHPFLHYSHPRLTTTTIHSHHYSHSPIYSHQVIPFTPLTAPIHSPTTLILTFTDTNYSHLLPQLLPSTPPLFPFTPQLLPFLSPSQLLPSTPNNYSHSLPIHSPQLLPFTHIPTSIHSPHYSRSSTKYSHPLPPTIPFIPPTTPIPFHQLHPFTPLLLPSTHLTTPIHSLNCSHTPSHSFAARFHSP
ncbi:DNA-directed RNA polymerase II subunit RPB1-like [Macrobrachium rosenbergii]|uniref:DNA-directed RNA polymerase II subunit RPB1-like n=1 Tax=Macrobrachium rosenbergii TaxID=79674 RepID=UPI0034D3A298